MLARITAARRIPQAFVARYSTSQKEGSVAQDKAFSKKERAHEDEYIHRHEMEQLAKMKKQIEKKKAELEDLERQREALENGTKQ
ncbi:hypothetical protein AX17_003038 [Amanita inopinata Kibby_2008]|nr:hypothetical protein AX17_003038 [Amanita inopinata Kibby_2008]